MRKKQIIKPEPVEAETLPQNGETVKEKFTDIVERDELGQRNAVYKRYKENVDYQKIGTEEYEETIGTIVAYRNSRGQINNQPRFKSGAELLGAIDAYWDFLLEQAKNGKKIVPDVEGLASYLGVSRQALMNWAKGEVNKEFAPIIAQTFNDIAAAKKQMGLHGKIPPIILAMDMNNNHGYVNQNNSKVEIEVSQREPMNAEQLLKMAALLPKSGDN